MWCKQCSVSKNNMQQNKTPNLEMYKYTKAAVVKTASLDPLSEL